MDKWLTEETSFKLKELGRMMPKGDHATTTECAVLIKELFKIVTTLSNEIDELKEKHNGNDWS